MMMAPEGEGIGILRMSLKYADWNQGVNAGSSILAKLLRNRAVPRQYSGQRERHQNVLISEASFSWDPARVTVPLYTPGQRHES